MSLSLLEMLGPHTLLSLLSLVLRISLIHFKIDNLFTMLVARGKYTAEAFQLCHLNETAALLAKSFIALNPIWKAFGIDFPTAYIIMRVKIRPFVQTPFSLVLIDENDKIVGCSITADIVFLQKTKQFKDENKIEGIAAMELFKFLGKVEEELEEGILTMQVPDGEVAYGYYGAVDPSIGKQGLAPWLFHAGFFQSKVANWKRYISRITSDFSYRLLMKMGAKELNRITVQLPERGLKDFTIYLIEIDLTTMNAQRAFL